ncbi:MAG: hypothetical protein LBG67_01660 [Campylobacteraceae bacterium]|nr:hypothetical protein [Campylobacteraceae bacterium]
MEDITVENMREAKVFKEEMQRAENGFNIKFTDEDIDFIIPLIVVCLNFPIDTKTISVGKKKFMQITVDLFIYLANLKKLKELGVSYEEEHPENIINGLINKYEEVKPFLKGEHELMPPTPKNDLFHIIRIRLTVFFNIEDYTIISALRDIESYVYCVKSDKIKTRLPRTNDDNSVLAMYSIIQFFDSDLTGLSPEEAKRLYKLIKKEVTAIKRRKNINQITRYSLVLDYGLKELKRLFKTKKDT